MLDALEDEGFHHPSLVATGSSADVFSAIDDENRLVAIKVLNQELAEIGNYRSQFLSTTARLDQLCTDNPNDVLVSILGTGEVGERPYLVMPYAAGGSLQERLEVSRTLGAPGRRATAALVASVLSEGLGLVHEAGLLHRDVKPSNVLIFANGLATSSPSASDKNGDVVPCLLTSDEELRLGDFGLATSYNELSYHGRLPAGTPGYAAPETLSANPEWTPQADIYSATICVIETLLGSQPGHNWPDELLRLGHSKRLVAELRVGTENAPSERHPSIEAWGERIQFALGQQARPWARWAVFAAVAAIVAASLAALSAYAVRSDEILTGRPPPLLAEDGFERCASSDEACPVAPEIVVRVTNQLELEVNHDGIGNTYRLEAQGEIVEVTNGGRFSYGAFRYPSATDPDPHERWTAEQLSLRVWACSTAGCTPSRAFVGVLGESDGQGADVTCLLNPGLREAHCLIRDTNQTESPASMQAFDTLYTCDEQEAGFLVPDGYGEGRLYLGCQVYLSDVRALDFRAVGHDDNSGDLVFGPEVSLLPS